jgi:hypothetical protein
MTKVWSGTKGCGGLPPDFLSDLASFGKVDMGHPHLWLGRVVDAGRAIQFAAHCAEKGAFYAHYAF